MRNGERKGYVYIMASKSRVLYIGVTSDLGLRVRQHQRDKYHGFSAKYRVHRLVYYEQHSSIVMAITRESQLKRWHREKKSRRDGVRTAAYHPAREWQIGRGKDSSAPGLRPSVGMTFIRSIQRCPGYFSNFISTVTCTGMRWPFFSPGRNFHFLTVSTALASKTCDVLRST